MLKIDNFIRFIEQYIFLNDLSIKSKGFRGNKQRSETRAIPALTQREASICMKKIHGKQSPAKLRKVFNSQGNLDRGKGDAFKNPMISLLPEVPHCVNYDVVEHAPLIFGSGGGRGFPPLPNVDGGSKVSLGRGVCTFPSQDLAPHCTTRKDNVDRGKYQTQGFRCRCHKTADEATPRWPDCWQ